MTIPYSKTIAERNEALHEDMKRAISIIDENSKPTKRWWHAFIKPTQPKTMFEIEGRPIFTEKELAERRAFLDGYSAGRTDGDCHEAYTLWRKMIDNSDK